MLNKGKFIVILIVAIIAALVATFVRFENADGQSVTLDLYFLNETSTSIQAQKRSIKYDYEAQLPDKVIEELKTGTSDGKSVGVMDENVHWSITRDDTRLVVDFSQRFLTTDATKNLLATYAVIKSLCQLDGVSAVKVTVEGGEIITPDNSRIDYLTDKDINLESDTQSGENHTIKLYFIDKETKEFYPESRAVKVIDQASPERYIVAELIKGPQREGLEAVLAPDTQILSAETTDGTAYINMPQSFVDKNSGSKEKELRAVYSIVNSVCELPEVNNVQFLIEGKKTTGFTNVDLSVLLYSNI